jgi:hypothetical protein
VPAAPTVPLPEPLPPAPPPVLPTPAPGVSEDPPPTPEAPPLSPEPETPREPEATPPPAGGEGAPPGFQFSPPEEKRAEEHADRLRADPGNAALHGYPEDLVKSVAASVALESGLRPLVIVFYDDTSRASHLQAAEFLPLLVRRRDRLDVLLIDVAASARWTAAERKLVRKYYGGYVPTTIALTADRRPLLHQYHRISAAVLEAALDAPPPR